METLSAAVIIADAIGFILSILVLALRWNKEWAEEQEKWSFVIVIVWIVIPVTEWLVLH
jgi:hypothetical protein